MISSDLYFETLSCGNICVFQLECVGWQLNLQMAQSSKAGLKSPSAVLQLGLDSEDSEVRTHTRGECFPNHSWYSRVRFFLQQLSYLL